VILAAGFVRVLCQILDKFEELLALAHEEPHGGQKLWSAIGAPCGCGLSGLRSSSVLGMAGCCREARVGIAWANVSPRSAVFRAAAVSRPPAGVHRKLHEVRNSSDLLGARCFAAGQRPKLVQVDRIGDLGSQVRVDECFVSEFILSVLNRGRFEAISVIRPFDTTDAAQVRMRLSKERQIFVTM
jgi:hypothetical protein